jgi:hypothetical protein
MSDARGPIAIPRVAAADASCDVDMCFSFTPSISALCAAETRLSSSACAKKSAIVALSPEGALSDYGG